MTSGFPTTRHSLILRLRDHGDSEAWEQFVAVYEPLVFRLAKMKGFQDADAREVVQEVLFAVSRAVERWQPDAQRGRFRDWLFCIARNMMIRFMTRRKFRSIGSGDSGIARLLEAEAADSGDESEGSAVFDLEYRREVFRWAADQVRRQVRPSTWRAFQMKAIEGRATAEVADALGMSVGAVHIACSRVRNRLRGLVANFECEARPT